MVVLLANLLLAQSKEPEQKVLVDRDKLEEVSKSITEGVGYDMPWELLIAGIGATLLVIVIVSLRRWWASRHEDPSPMVLFTAIARKAGLGWRDRLLLWRVSRAFNLPTPITLMLSRGALRHYIDLYLSSRSGSSSRRIGQRAAQIESTLFG